MNLLNRIIIWVFFVSLGFPFNVYAGAAVQATRQKQAVQQQRQAIQQRLIVEQQLLQKQVIQRSNARWPTPPPAPGQQQESAPQSKTLTSKPVPTDHVPVTNFWQMLSSSSKVWRQVVKPSDKTLIVAHYITEFRQRGIAISKHPSRYVALIDDMAKNNPPILENPFDRVLQIAAVMEYDFNNGQDKELLARQLLGEQGYSANKRRLGIYQSR